MKHSSYGYGSGVLKHCGPACGEARVTSAPKHLVKEGARNTLDQARGTAPNSGRTAGQHQAGKKGSGND